MIGQYHEPIPYPYLGAAWSLGIDAPSVLEVGLTAALGLAKAKTAGGFSYEVLRLQER